MSSASAPIKRLTEECVVVSGPPASGKTETLVSHVAALLQSGIPASSIAVFSANPCAALQLGERICNRTGNEEMRERTFVPWQIGLKILECARGKEERPRHVLVKDEFDLLMEDMKKIEGDRKRNREIIKFLLRELTELGDDKEGMIFSEEERRLRSALEERAENRNAIMRHQISPKAVRCLADNPELARRFSVPYVIADDFTNLSRASQILLDSMHTEQIVVAGCPPLSLETYEPYPYERGIDELVERRGGANVRRIDLEECHLSKGVSRFSSLFAESSESLAEAFPRKKADDARCGKASIKQFLSIRDEIDNVAALILNEPEEIRGKTAIIVPNDKWGAAVAAELEDRGAKPCLWANDAPLAPKRHDANFGRAFDLLGIAADSTDACAWRSYLSHSAGFVSCGLWEEVLEFSKENGIDAGRAMRLLARSGSESGLPHAEQIASLAEEGLSSATAISLKTGACIATATAHATGCDETQLARAWRACDDDTCEKLYRRLRNELLFPVGPAKSTISIGTANALAGTSWEIAYVIGALDKMYPSAQAIKADETIDHKRLYMARDERVYYTAITRAFGSLRVSFPTREPLETAEKMSLGVRRIYSTESGRIALLTPSRFLRLEKKAKEGRIEKEREQ